MYIILSQRIDLESDYEDIPFLRYHFPKRYRSQINFGDLFIYNQGNRYNKDHRFYFGCGKIGKIWRDREGDNFFAEIINGERFSKKVLIHKSDGSYIESIDYKDVRERKNPPFRSAVRKVSQSAYSYIIGKADGFSLINRNSIQDLLIEALENNSGSANIVTIRKYVWKFYEMDLRKSGNFFYTWQYDIRWAATQLRDSGRIKTPDQSPKGIWELNT